MSTALIDVLIPVFNAAKTIGDAIESIRRQTVRDIRIVVVDDGSTDDTAGVLASVARADPRVEVFTKANGGIVDALNFGLSRCRSKFLARHDGDDLADPDRFAKQIAYLRSHPDCVAVGGAARHIDEGGRPLGHTARISFPEGADPCWVPSKEPYILHPFLMTYRASVRDVGGYRHAFHAEDTDLYWRLSETGRLHNLDDVLGSYRMHAGSVSSASVVNGRISALNSQLASISALRRRQQRPDLVFDGAAIREYGGAGSMEDIFRFGARQLTRTEADRLEISVAAKLLELTSYRPFELDLEDCRFIKRALTKHMGTLAPDNRAGLQKMWCGAAARLARNARLRGTTALIQPRLYPAVLSRLAFRALVPSPVRGFVLGAIGRPDVANFLK